MTIELPDYLVTKDGEHVTEMLIAEPCWLYMWKTTNLEDGLSWLTVYRSMRLVETWSMYGPVEDAIRGLTQISTETIHDHMMMGYSAEAVVYDLQTGSGTE